MDKESIRGLLQPGERLLWEGAPERGIRLQRSDWYTIPFSLVWCGMLCIIIGPQIRIASVLPLMGLIYVPFILAGLYLLAGRFFFRAYRLSGMRYAVTDKRAIIVNRRETVSLLYRQIPMLQKEIRRRVLAPFGFSGLRTTAAEATAAIFPAWALRRSPMQRRFTVCWRARC